MAVRLAGHALPVGIMPAWSYDKGDVRKLTLVFEPIAFVGLGNEVEGRMTRSNLVITRGQRRSRPVATVLRARRRQRAGVARGPIRNIGASDEASVEQAL